MKFVYELNHGKGSFDPREDRGYYGVALQSLRREGYIAKDDKKYRITDEGKKKLRELRQEFPKGL